MANRCSKRTTQNSRNTQRLLWSAVSAVSALIVVVGAVLVGQQADRARTEALARRAGERLQVLQREAERLASQESTLLNDLRKLEVERQLKGEELKQLDAEAARVGAELTATTERMEALQKSEAAERPELRARGRNLQARSSALPAPAALHARSPAHRSGLTHGRRDGQARSRSHRLASAHARRAEIGARDTSGAPEGADHGPRRGGESAGRRAARRAGAQRSHSRHRSPP